MFILYDPIYTRTWLFCRVSNTIYCENCWMHLRYGKASRFACTILKKVSGVGYFSKSVGSQSGGFVKTLYFPYKEIIPTRSALIKQPIVCFAKALPQVVTNKKHVLYHSKIGLECSVFQFVEWRLFCNVHFL